MGGRAIACLNSRDRNVLGFRRDLLTAAAYGVESFLLVYGDRPDLGRRSDDVSVRRMMEEIRAYGSSDVFAGCAPFEIGVTTRLTPSPRSSTTPTSSSPRSATRSTTWPGGATTATFDGPVYAGVMVVASAAMARKLGAESPQLAVPPWLIDAVDADRDAGVDAACALVERRPRPRRLRRRPRRRRRPLPARSPPGSRRRVGREPPGRRRRPPDSVRRRAADRAAQGFAGTGHARAVRGRRPRRGALVGRRVQGVDRRPPGRRGAHPAPPGDPDVRRRGAVRHRDHRPRLDRGDEQRRRQPRRAALLQGDDEPDPDGRRRRRRLRRAASPATSPTACGCRRSTPS